MAGPVALFLTENIIEAIGLAVGVADLAGAADTPRGAHGIPLTTPYMEIERFSLSQSRVVVGDKINASGVLKIGLGQLADHTFYHGEGNAWYSTHVASWGFRIRSSGGLNARAFQIVSHREKTPTPGSYSWKTYEVEGSGPGGYVTESIGPVNARPRRLRIRKISDEGNPIIRVPFNIILQARAVANEEIWIEADVSGYKAEIGADAKAKANDTSERLTVEVSIPYRTSATTAPMHVKHGERVDATLRLTNLSYENELLWKNSQLDGDIRGGSKLPSRKSGRNERMINHWAEGHAGEHPCYAEETWVEKAFDISPWRVNDLKIRLLKKPDWKDSWEGQVFEIDCVKKCSQYDWFLNWLRRLFGFPGSGQVEQRGTRTYWKPLGETQQEQGTNEQEQPKPPMRSEKSVGFRGVVTPRYHVPSDIYVKLTSSVDPSNFVELALDQEGAFLLEEWPFTGAANCAVTAATSHPQLYDDVTEGTVLEVSLFPATRSVRGKISVSRDNIYKKPFFEEIIVFARAADDETEVSDEDTIGPYLVQVDEEGNFEFSNLPIGQSLAVYIHSPLFRMGFSVAPVVIDADDEEPLVIFNLDDALAPPADVNIKGKFEGLESMTGTVSVISYPQGNLLMTTDIKLNGEWSVANLISTSLVYLSININDKTFQGAPFLLTEDLEIPTLSLSKIVNEIE